MSNNASVYVIAAYIRLSKEDVDITDVTAEKKESGSITNQRMLIQDFIKSRNEFEGCKIIEKCDDGFSGKKFDRPQFTELIEMVKKGEVNCIIVKDFSRFGRDYIELGDYLEQIFPFFRIRFISINDNYDSACNNRKTNGLETAFKNIIYDYYSREVSKKVRLTRKKLAKDGCYAGFLAPYGYLKSCGHKNPFIINQDTAPVVKEIFALRLKGISAAQITRILNGKKIPSPAQYAFESGLGDLRGVYQCTAWNANRVMNILRDERYTGHMVSQKWETKGVCGKAVKTGEKDWIKVRDTHEGIISEELFRAVQALLPNRRNRISQKEFNPFTCGGCGRKLSLQKNYFVCRFGENNPLSGCYKAKYEAEEIKSAVLEELLRHITWFYPWDKDTRKWKKSSTESVQKGEHYTQKINALRREQLMLYKKFKSGKMKKNEYLIKKEEKNKKIRKNEYLKKQNKEETDGEERVIRRYMDEIKINDKKTEPAWLIHCRIGNELTSELRETFINKVFVYSSERIKIVWRFQDVFT